MMGLVSMSTEGFSPAVAYVMNIATKESWKYTNYPFLHIINIGDLPYGVASDGLYLLEGPTDNGTLINGTITTAQWDFNTNKAKNVPQIYMSSDTTTRVTPIVDDVHYPVQTSTFNGRRCDMPLGIEGRYWQFKIERIVQFTGIQATPQLLQRSVK
jgi:hypothetical protein